MINTTGCYSYNYIRIDDSEKHLEYDWARITDSNGDEFYLRDVVIHNAVITGYRYTGRSEIDFAQSTRDRTVYWDYYRHVITSYKDIMMIKVKELNIVNTVSLVAVSLALIIWVATMEEEDKTYFDR